MGRSTNDSQYLLGKLEHEGSNLTGAAYIKDSERRCFAMTSIELVLDQF